MSELTKYVQTIAKTDLLEEKISRATAQSNTAVNSDIGQSPIASERSIAIADGTTSTGTTVNNTATLDNQAGSVAGSPLFGLGYVPAGTDTSGSPNGTDSGNVSLANLSGGLTAAQEAANQVAQANSILNSGAGTNAAQDSAIKSYNGTNPSSGGSGGASGGSNAYTAATGTTSPIVPDAGLAKLNASAAYQNSNPTDQLNMLMDYVNNGKLPDGNGGDTTATGDQISTGTYPRSYNPLQNPLNAIIGFDPNGNISTSTGGIMALMVRLDGKTPIPTAGDMKSNDMAGVWTTPTNPPSYIPPSYQAGYYWQGASSSSTTAYSQTAEAVISAMEAYFQSSVVVPHSGTYTGFQGAFTSTTPGSGTSYQLGDLGGMAAANPSGVALFFKFGYIEVDGVTKTYGFIAGGLTKCPGTDPGTDPVHSMCFIGPPGLVTATGWPKTGVAIASFINGKLTYNPYDTELPAYLAAQPESSVIKLAAGDGVNVLNTDVLEIQAAVNGGILVQVFNASNVYQTANYYDSKGLLTVPAIPSALAASYYQINP